MLTLCFDLITGPNEEPDAANVMTIRLASSCICGSFRLVREIQRVYSCWCLSSFPTLCFLNLHIPYRCLEACLVARSRDFRATRSTWKPRPSCVESWRAGRTPMATSVIQDLFARLYCYSLIPDANQAQHRVSPSLGQAPCVALAFPERYFHLAE